MRRFFRIDHVEIIADQFPFLQYLDIELRPYDTLASIRACAGLSYLVSLTTDSRPYAGTTGNIPENEPEYISEVGAEHVRPSVSINGGMCSHLRVQFALGGVVPPSLQRLNIGLIGKWATSRHDDDDNTRWRRDTDVGTMISKGLARGMRELWSVSCFVPDFRDSPPSAPERCWFCRLNTERVWYSYTVDTYMHHDGEFDVANL